ncbi:MAG: hypothetical protein NMNS01_23920 [Nitrosomonas sp.]|nr:MAG: hypothetical protein NMNS01_23920 [Nitrosomonas sp.]
MTVLPAVLIALRFAVYARILWHEIVLFMKKSVNYAQKFVIGAPSSVQLMIWSIVRNVQKPAAVVQKLVVLRQRKA